MGRLSAMVGCRVQVLQERGAPDAAAQAGQDIVQGQQLGMGAGGSVKHRGSAVRRSAA